MNAFRDKRPWRLAVMVNGKWLQFRQPQVYGSADIGKNAADRNWKGAFCKLTHKTANVCWVRRAGSWFREDPPAGPDPRAAAAEKVGQ